MGDIAEMMIEGILCQECGVFMDEGEASGHPRFCRDCGGDPECNYAAKRRGKSKKRVPCPECGKRFKTEAGMKDHRRVVHK